MYEVVIEYGTTKRDLKYEDAHDYVERSTTTFKVATLELIIKLVRDKTIGKVYNLGSRLQCDIVALVSGELATDNDLFLESKGMLELYDATYTVHIQGVEDMESLKNRINSV
jgi:hypothetical protein